MSFDLKKIWLNDKFPTVISPFFFVLHSQRHAELSLWRRQLVDRQPPVAKKPDVFQSQTGRRKEGHRWDRIESTICGDKFSWWRHKSLARCLRGTLTVASRLCWKSPPVLQVMCRTFSTCVLVQVTRFRKLTHFRLVDLAMSMPGGWVNAYYIGSRLSLSNAITQNTFIPRFSVHPGLFPWPYCGKVARFSIPFIWKHPPWLLRNAKNIGISCSAKVF